MDELLELMNDENGGSSQDITYESVEEPKASSGDNEKGRNGKPDERKTIVTPSRSSTGTKFSSSSDRECHRIHGVEQSVDDRLGIRMTNRLVSSSDLLDLVTDFAYFSPSVLSAMSL